MHSQLAEDERLLSQPRSDQPQASRKTDPETVSEKVIGFTLFFTFGIAPWLIVNALFVELPILIDQLPEGYNIATYLSVAIQASNISALLYIILQHYRPIPHSIAISAILICSIATSLLLSFFWNWQLPRPASHTSDTFSFGILLLCFFGGCVGCSSVVIFYPFASQFAPLLISAVSIGGAANALVASGLGTIQNPGTHSRFSIGWFFRIISVFCGLSFAAFLFLNFFWRPIEKFRAGNSQISVNSDEGEEVPEVPPTLWDRIWKVRSYLINQFAICTMSYIMIGLGPYSFKGFESAQALIRWSNITGIALGAVSRFLTAWYLYPSMTLLSVCQVPMFFILFIFSIGVIDKTRLPNTIGWLLLGLVVNCIYSIFYGYTDTLIYQKVAKEVRPRKDVEASTRFVGFANQSGAFIGTLFSFLLVLKNIPQ